MGLYFLPFYDTMIYYGHKTLKNTSNLYVFVTILSYKTDMLAGCPSPHLNSPQIVC